MFALYHTGFATVLCGKYDLGNANCDELVALAEEKARACGKRMEVLIKVGFLQ
jgi:hypothetical protein